MTIRTLSTKLAATSMVVSAVLASMGAPAQALGSMNVTCVASSPTSCTATFALVANMDVNLTFLLPANAGFYENVRSGTGPAEYTYPDGYTSGTGPSFTVLLQTPATEPANAQATITFVLTPLGTATTTTTTTASHQVPGAVTITFGSKSYALSATAKTRLRALATRLVGGARVTSTGYALSNAPLARNQALVVANFLYGKVKVYTKVVNVTTRPLNKVTVVTTSL